MTLLIIISALILVVVLSLIASKPKPVTPKKKRETPLQHMNRVERKMFGH